MIKKYGFITFLSMLPNFIFATDMPEYAARKGSDFSAIIVVSILLFIALVSLVFYLKDKLDQITKYKPYFKEGGYNLCNRYYVSYFWSYFKPRVLFIEALPSDKETIRTSSLANYTQICKSMGYGGFYIGYLFPISSGSKDKMLKLCAKKNIRTIADIHSPSNMSLVWYTGGAINERYLSELSHKCRLSIAIWGEDGSLLDMGMHITNLLKGVKCFGQLDSGQPTDKINEYLSVKEANLRDLDLNNKVSRNATEAKVNADSTSSSPVDIVTVGTELVHHVLSDIRRNTVSGPEGSTHYFNQMTYEDYVPFNGNKTINMHLLPESYRKYKGALEIFSIVECESPVLISRVYKLYLKYLNEECSERLRHDFSLSLKFLLHNKSLEDDSNTDIFEYDNGKYNFYDFYTLKLPGTQSVRVRTIGPRSFDEIPDDEISQVFNSIELRNTDVYEIEECINLIFRFYEYDNYTEEEESRLYSLLWL